MPRFDNLEIDPPEEPDSLRLAGEEEHDERYWLRLADENRRQGHHDNALRFYSRALELNRSLIAGWLGQVQMLIAMEEYPEAELWSRKALELFRNHGDLLAGRAQAIARQGDASQAFALCDTALKQEGTSPYRWMVRGELLVAQKQDLDRHCFDKATLLAEKDWLVPLEIGAIYMHYGVPSKALLRFKQALAEVSDNPHVWFRRAECERVLDLEDAARRSLQRCLHLSPTHLEANRLLTELDHQGWSLWRTVSRLLQYGRS